ncbi:hypothetical protein AVDCRST_MAG94-4711 [uncultured Leptolyngbya sp.]|uniref:Uncharacterized protein n=1 Tax=uncultured Leptolyngbya sp. TaxID=332963 RepID=A0A6J4N5Z6_9CYAN|nr:hypothetical protein AVDCRST_MAG94-4711 [uncultured Leptolyngbya sp.]
MSRLTTASSNRGFVHHPENGWLAAGGSNSPNRPKAETAAA